MANQKPLTFVSLNRARSGGFSLVELMVAIGISSAVLMFSFQVIAEQQKLYSDLESRLSVGNEAERVSSKIGRILESAGGQGIAPWQAIFLENNCAPRWVFSDCQNSDRLTLLSLKLKADNSFHLNYIVSSYDPPSGTITLVPSTCGEIDFLVGETVALYLNTGELMTRRVVGFDNIACTLASEADKQSVELTTTTTNTFLSATMNVVKISTFYLDRNQNKVLTFINSNNNDSIDSGEIKSQFENVYDFQLALGYDFNPRDGGVFDSKDNTDEWLYNSPSPIETWGTDAFLTTQVSRSDLVMIQVALVIGGSTKGLASGDKTILDGQPTLANGKILRVVNKNFIFKNLTTY